MISRHAVKSAINIRCVKFSRDEGEDGEKKREWKDEKKSEEMSGDKEEKDEDKLNDKDKVGNWQP